jgi:hypothetical protein
MLGRYNTVTILKFNDKKAYLKMMLAGDSEIALSETLIAVTREDTIKMIG